MESFKDIEKVRGNFIPYSRNKKMMRIISAIGLTLVLVVLLIMPVNGAVSAENDVEMSFDGEEINNLIGFYYKVYKDRQDVSRIGNNDWYIP